MGVARPILFDMSDPEYSGARIKFRCGEKDYNIKVKEKDASASVNSGIYYKDSDGVHYGLTRDDDGHDAIRYDPWPKAEAEFTLKAKIEDDDFDLLKMQEIERVAVIAGEQEICGHLKAIRSDGHIEVVAYAPAPFSAVDLPSGWKRPADWNPRMLMPLPSEAGAWATKELQVQS